MTPRFLKVCIGYSGTRPRKSGASLGKKSPLRRFMYFKEPIPKAHDSIITTSYEKNRNDLDDSYSSSNKPPRDNNNNADEARGTSIGIFLAHSTWHRDAHSTQGHWMPGTSPAITNHEPRTMTWVVMQM